MTANPSYFPSAAGPELPFPGPCDPALRLDLVAGWRSNQLSVAGVLCADSADRLSAVLNRLAQLIRPTILQLDRIRWADEAGIEPIFHSATLRQQQGLAPLRVATVSYPVLDVFAALGVTWSPEQDVSQWQRLEVALYPSAQAESSS
jgi:hypothetical protein